ncbi:MAG TPA: hypothetical protein VG125_07360 [Pirellulales bacterium]|jgi:hypothetical protein|nr:hypothetical protein [Pirellulales bacterium]
MPAYPEEPSLLARPGTVKKRMMQFGNIGSQGIDPQRVCEGYLCGV